MRINLLVFVGIAQTKLFGLRPPGVSKHSASLSQSKSNSPEISALQAVCDPVSTAPQKLKVRGPLAVPHIYTDASTFTQPD